MNNEEIKKSLEKLCEGYDKNLNFEYQADEFLYEIEKQLTKARKDGFEEGWSKASDIARQDIKENYADIDEL